MRRNSREKDEKDGTWQPNGKGDCYVCTETATFLCTRCGGHVCDEHAEDGPDVCVNCC